MSAHPASGDHGHVPELGLTRREDEIIRWVSEGKRDREIATILGISARTVHNHVHHILEKLEVETRTAAAKVAFENLHGGRTNFSARITRGPSNAAIISGGSFASAKVSPRRRPCCP